MTSHYSTLGVPRDADAATIKRAYRKKSSKAHPDRKGGDHQAMVAITRAYETLSDPEKRSRYDQTGQDSTAAGNDPDTKARNLLMQLFAQALEKVDETQDIIEILRINLRNNRQQIEQQIIQLSARIPKLEKRRKRLKYTGAGRNFLLDLIDQMLTQIPLQVLAAKDQCKTIDRGLELLQGFAYEPEPAQAMAVLFNVGGGTGTWGAWK